MLIPQDIATGQAATPTRSAARGGAEDGGFDAVFGATDAITDATGTEDRPPAWQIARAAPPARDRTGDAAESAAEEADRGPAPEEHAVANAEKEPLSQGAVATALSAADPPGQQRPVAALKGSAEGRAPAASAAPISGPTAHATPSQRPVTEAAPVTATGQGRIDEAAPQGATHIGGAAGYRASAGQRTGAPAAVSRREAGATGQTGQQPTPGPAPASPLVTPESAGATAATGTALAPGSLASAQQRAALSLDPAGPMPEVEVTSGPLPRAETAATAALTGAGSMGGAGTPAGAPQLAPQLAMAARALADGPVEIQLAPAELGRVTLTLTAGDGGITVAVLAERAETLDLLRRNIGLLAQELRDLGFASPGFAFAEGRHPRQTAQIPPADAPVSTATVALQPAAASALPIAATGLDLRW